MKRKSWILVAFSSMVVGILVWLCVLLCRNGNRGDGDVGIGQVSAIPSKEQEGRASYCNALPNYDTKFTPSIKVGFFDEDGNPVSLEGVTFTLGVLKPFDGKFPPGIRLGSFTLNGHTGFKTALAIDEDPTNEKIRSKLGVRYILAGQYCEIIARPTDDGFYMPYEIAPFQAPRYEAGKTEYSVNVVLHKKAQPKPVASKIHIRGVAPPEVDGLRKYYVTYFKGLDASSWEKAVNGPVDAGEPFDLEVDALGGSLVVNSLEVSRMVGCVETVTSLDVGQVKPVLSAVEYRIKRHEAKHKKEGLLFFRSEDSPMWVGLCGFENKSMMETSIFLPEGEYWYEPVHTDASSEGLVRGVRAKIVLGEKRDLELPFAE